MILRLVKDVKPYRIALKLIKEWANVRGIYSNKMGYFGGVNLAILMCYISELYPSACAAYYKLYIFSVLLEKFFYIYQQYNWKNPIKLCKHQKLNTDLDQYMWDPEINKKDQGHIMILLTPAYPGQNSTSSVNAYSIKTISEEFKRGNKIMKEIKNGSSSWDKLIEPTDFFYKYSHYLKITISAADDVSFNKWCGYCEAKYNKIIF